MCRCESAVRNLALMGAIKLRPVLCSPNASIEEVHAGAEPSLMRAQFQDWGALAAPPKQVKPTTPLKESMSDSLTSAATTTTESEETGDASSLSGMCLPKRWIHEMFRKDASQHTCSSSQSSSTTTSSSTQLSFSSQLQPSSLAPSDALCSSVHQLIECNDDDSIQACIQ